MSSPTPHPQDVETLDPRARRSRRMLHDALATLLVTKDFDKISIQDIAETSTLNRATFYDHYPDKFALLQCMVGSRFGELMARRNVRIEDCEGALRAIALGVCDYLGEAPSSGGISHQGVMQTAIVSVVYGMFLGGMHDRKFVGSLESDVVCSTIAWAIYGAASAWSQKTDRCSAEQMADLIKQLVIPMIANALVNEPGHMLPAKQNPTNGI
jgi:AcrR family transcriptional regulator